MPSSDRDDSRDRNAIVRHQHSFSEVGRSSVPMWDSSDPDRAPPPLPLNPSASSPATTRPNTSAAVAARATELSERIRDSAPSAYISNPSPSPTKSPERSLIKGAHHKRMQSSNVRDLSSYLESRSPERAPPRTPVEGGGEKSGGGETHSPRHSETTPTPNFGKDLSSASSSGRETPILRPSSRYLSKPILGENTPPSATMLALQNMQIPAAAHSSDQPLSNITNNSSALVRSPQSFDAISNQILSLTGIATSLQREMANLSRRSKDNATDLLSLKEATNARDEDIRKSLKDLVTNISAKFLENSSHDGLKEGDGFHRGSVFLDSRPFGSPTGSRKNFSLPRIPSPNSFAAAIERDLTASPSTISSDGSASIALLEKILREMSTKDGQEKLVKMLSDLKSKSPGSSTDPLIMKKLEEIVQLVKDSVDSRALVRATKNGRVSDKPPQIELDFESPRSGPVAHKIRDDSPQMNRSVAKHDDGGSAGQASDFVNEEMMKILKRIKNSVADTGGLTNETKSLLRDLRGEVLGMGREIARKLSQLESGQDAYREAPRGPSREDISQIVEGGLLELKDHMNQLIREQRRHSASSQLSRATVDLQEVYSAVKSALDEYPLPAPQNNGTGIEREEILEAVREAWETYKPEIELQNFGLEREEILDCLKEGLKAYEAKDQTRDPGITYEEVLDAVTKGMQTFTPPPVESESTITRDEIVASVRECLESFDFPEPAPVTTREADLTREDVIDAVKEGLLNQGSIAKELEFNRNDLFEAVKAGLEGAPTPMQGVGEQVLDKMHELLEGMRGEFKQYAAANGRDTEQVLDAVKDGLEILRGDIESYVDRAADVTGKDEIIDVVKENLRLVQADLESALANAPRPRTSDTAEMLDAMEKEFEHLRQTISNMLIREGGSGDKAEILDAIREIADREKDDSSSIVGNQSTQQILTTVKEEFEHLRETLATTIMRPGLSSEKDEILDAIREVGMERRRPDGTESILSNTSELLDAFNDGLDGLKSDLEKIMNKPVDLSTNYEILDTLKDGLAGLKEDIDRLQVSQKEFEDASTNRGREVMIAEENQLKADIEGLKVMITQLRIKVESLDIPAPPAPEPAVPPGLNKDDLEEVHSSLRQVRESVDALGAREIPVSESAATKDDVEAIETLMRNAKAKLDDLTSYDPEGVAKPEHVESVEAMVKETKDAIDELAANMESNAASKDDVGAVETLLKELATGIDEVHSSVNRSDEEVVTKADIQAVETLCLDTKTQIQELPLPDVETLPTKIDITALEEKINGFKEQVEAESELTAQAFEARKTEHGGLSNKIEDVKSLLCDLRDELKSQLEDSQQGLVELGKTLDTWNEDLSKHATAKSLEELTELVNREFERSHGDHEAAKADLEERDAALLARHDETRSGIVADLASKIDESFNELMTKYDDAQLAADEKLNAFDTRDSQNLETLTSTKAVVDDVKLLIDTLGTTVSEACERMTDDSKAVYTKVDDVASKLEEVQAGSTSEHALTRDEVAKGLAATGRVESQLAEWHPQILTSVKDILLMVSQHYEHSQKSSDDLKASVAASISAIPMPAITAPDTPPLPRDIPEPEKYDDSQIHDKLNVLLNHATAAGKSFAQIDRLDQIHEQVKTTAGEVSEMVATQSRLMAEDHASKQQEAQEAAVALEKRIAQKERVESEVISLNEEKDALLSVVQTLKQEKEDLARQNHKLSNEVASLETALHIRREEMRIMEDRAESLERRILDGVLDHARSVLISRPGSAKDMNLKRVPSSSSASTITRTSMAGGSHDSNVLSSGVGMALKRRTPMSSKASSVASNAGKERRILSLSHVTGNKVATDRQMMLAPSRVDGGITSLKRSHSVKSNFPARKSSWTGRGSVVDKENVFHEEDEHAAASGDEGSEAGTERRTSYTGTETTASYDAETTERRTSYRGTDDRRTSYSGTITDSMIYGTGSYVSTITDTEGRHSSYGTSTGALVAGAQGSEEEESDEIAEDGEETSSSSNNVAHHDERQLVLKQVSSEDTALTTVRDDNTCDHDGKESNDLLDGMLQELEPPPPPPQPKPTVLGHDEIVMYGQVSDSGLGTDAQTADLAAGQDYFAVKKG